MAAYFRGLHGRTHCQSKAILIILAASWAVSSSASANSGVPAIPAAGMLSGSATHAVSSWQRMQEAILAVRGATGLRSLLANQANSLMIDRSVTFGGIDTFKFQHYYKGVEVLGSMAFHHRVAGYSNVLSAVTPFDLDVSPSISSTTAASLAKAATQGRLTGKPELKILPTDEGSATLVYWVTVEAPADLGELDGLRDILVDAHSGRIAAEMPREMTIAPVDVYSAANVPDEDNDPESGAPLRLRFSAMDHVVQSGQVLARADTAARRAAANATKTLRYYQDRFDRDSYDGAGGTVTNIVHIGRNFANAFWSSTHKVMAYGDGDGKRTGDFTLGVDVAGHEMTHGVVSEAVTSGSVKGLMYFGESGALNEAFADFFGKMIEGEGNWVLGQDLFLRGEDKLKGIRNIANPNALTVTFRNEDGEVEVKPYPAHMDEKFIAKGTCSRANDYCWVHINSTIWSHAAYRIHNAIGRAKTEQLYYVVLNHLLTPRSGFTYAQRATNYACGLLYDSHTCNKVKTALAGVGL